MIKKQPTWRVIPASEPEFSYVASNKFSGSRVNARDDKIKKLSGFESESQEIFRLNDLVYLAGLFLKRQLIKKIIAAMPAIIREDSKDFVNRAA